MDNTDYVVYIIHGTALANSVQQIDIINAQLINDVIFHLARAAIGARPYDMHDRAVSSPV